MERRSFWYVRKGVTASSFFSPFREMAMGIGIVVICIHMGARQIGDIVVMK